MWIKWSNIKLEKNPCNAKKFLHFRLVVGFGNQAVVDSWDIFPGWDDSNLLVVLGGRFYPVGDLVFISEPVGFWVLSKATIRATRKSLMPKRWSKKNCL